VGAEESHKIAVKEMDSLQSRYECDRESLRAKQRHFGDVDVNGGGGSIVQLMRDGKGRM
jgi:hypothetical protein